LPEYATLPAVSRASSARTRAEYDEAVQMLNGAIGKVPGGEFSACAAGWTARARFNQYGSARREVEIFVRHAPKDANSWLNLATLCERLGDRPGAATANARYRWIVDAFARGRPD